MSTPKEPVDLYTAVKSEPTASPSSRCCDYSFAVFEQVNRHWSKVRSHIEDLDVAIAIAIHTLAEHALRSTKTDQ